MSTELRIPKLGMSMTEATLTEWLAADGAQVSSGALVYAIETDKTVTEIEAPVGGVLRISAEPGEIYPVGELVGTIE
ncbi:biotin/lipoyl-containing protein [Phenylobacterium sp.]|uniref:biotin/lipoyl-containing protein n=1 Tax=Phenylobacterium sp. TaxID=1871053 RepID=UPI002DEDF9EE|nr:biotin/lipoyl-containing protein [Phenylobacterium sp.]